MNTPAAMSDLVASVNPSSPNHAGQGASRAATNTGTRQMRTRVMTLAGVSSRSLPER